jgi:DNA-binding IclR family transcriptional regulator
VSQYSVLQALREAGQEGLACREIAQRLLTRDPDITRLVDRLEVRGLVSRHEGGRIAGSFERRLPGTDCSSSKRWIRRSASFMSATRLLSAGGSDTKAAAA